MEMEKIFGQHASYQEDKPWFSVLDIILGLSILALLIVFLFISIGYLNKHLKKQNKIHEVVSTNTEILVPIKTITSNSSKIPTKITIAQDKKINLTQNSTVQEAIVTTTQQQNKVTQSLNIQEVIYETLLEEFRNDLPHWLAKIDYTSLTIRFQNPNIFFEVGDSSLNQYYQLILDDFFPRYINKLIKYKSVIEAISIEGHTSSEWRGSVSKNDAYFNNMALSQERTRAVLEYCLLLAPVKSHRNWLRHTLTANGFSSSRLIMEKSSENVEVSRRVEFRIYLFDGG
ncbi:OmpA family protein [Candidatus Parabeggiatoa sp. HSG14]|uniref:OmpA family protein n=1 Tax=Candidatus Parabeggiatoa sp. HSG14 TaxID=3055593 RepID=UPI0025A713CF|nr:OmpA family protein [Thiotrichales bacterium HSG14]